MRNAFFAFVLLLVSATAFAQPETLLTPDGTFYTIESVRAEDHPEVSTSASRFLMFSVHHGEEIQEGIIPASMAPGTHSEPAFAYDSESKRLFVFWRHARTLAESELLFCSLNEDGEWTEATGVDKAALRYRENFRIGITRKTEVIDEAGNKTVVPETNVHAIWWDAGDREAARYAMLTIQNGVVTSTYVSYLSELEGKAPERIVPGDQPTPELLKANAVVESRKGDSIEFVYGDRSSNAIRRITIKPIVNVRIHIPIGRGSEVPAPRFDSLSSEQPFLAPGEGDQLVIGAIGDETMRYMLYDGNSWSDARVLRLGKKLTRSSALAAVKRMVDSN